jgi:hypothetical protein
MRRIVIRAPTCGADLITFLKRVLTLHAQELQRGERIELAFDIDRFPFATSIFESLLAGADLRAVAYRREDAGHVFEAEKT